MTQQSREDPRIKAVRDIASHRRHPVLVLSSQRSISGGLLHKIEGATRGKRFSDLDFCITSNGGSPEAAYLIMSMLRRRAERIHAVIPSRAMSAATLMALGCDSIVLATRAHLGPIDVQVGEHDELGAFGWHSAQTTASVMPEAGRMALHHAEHVLSQLRNARVPEADDIPPLKRMEMAVEAAGEFMRPLLVRVNPMSTARDRYVSECVKMYAETLMQRVSDPLAPSKIRSIVKIMSTGYQDHAAQITSAEAKSRGLPIESPSKQLRAILDRPGISWEDWEALELLPFSLRGRAGAGDQSSTEAAALGDTAGLERGAQ